MKNGQSINKSMWPHKLCDLLKIQFISRKWYETPVHSHMRSWSYKHTQSYTYIWSNNNIKNKYKTTTA